MFECVKRWYFKKDFTWYVEDFLVKATWVGCIETYHQCSSEEGIPTTIPDFNIHLCALRDKGPRTSFVNPFNGEKGWVEGHMELTNGGDEKLTCEIAKFMDLTKESKNAPITINIFDELNTAVTNSDIYDIKCFYRYGGLNRFLNNEPKLRDRLVECFNMSEVINALDSCKRDEFGESRKILIYDMRNKIQNLLTEILGEKFTEAVPNFDDLSQLRIYALQTIDELY